MSGDVRIDLSALAPALVVALGAVVVLLGEVLLSRRKTVLGRPATERWIGSLLALVAVAALGLAALIAYGVVLSGGHDVFNSAHPMLRLDRFSAFGTGLVAVGSLLACLLSVAYLAELRINHGEYYALILLAAAGMMLLVAATDLMLLFLGLELMSIPIYVLAGFHRSELRSNEAALKYFLVGSFASAILLYGMALLYGATGSTSYGGIRAAFPTASPLALTGLALLLVGFAFKVSSVPFHQWTPDVYEGSPTSVTAFMAVTVKVAAFLAFLRVLVEGFGPLHTYVTFAGRLTDVLWVLAALTMVVGNLMALIQDNVKRLLAYSSIAHAGYVLVGFVTATPEAYAGVLFYLAVYLFMNLGAFGVLIVLTGRGRDCERIDDLAGLAERRPALAALMTLFLLSLAGIPGTGGFIAKFLIFQPAVAQGWVVLTVIGVLASLVSVFYYLRIPVAMYMREPGDAPLRARIAPGEWVVLALCAAAVLLLGFFPLHGPSGLAFLRPLEWAQASVALLF